MVQSLRSRLSRTVTGTKLAQFFDMENLGTTWIKVERKSATQVKFKNLKPFMSQEAHKLNKCLIS